MAPAATALGQRSTKGYKMNQTAPISTPDEPVSLSAYRAAMAKVAAPVHIITTRCGDRNYGMTATAVCSVTDTPPRLLVCINRTAQSYQHFLTSRVLAVNTVSGADQEIAAVFAGAGGIKDMDVRFGHGAWDELQTGAPVLASAISAFDCRIIDVTQQQTHDILLCDVVGLRVAEEPDPLLYFDRRFVTLARQG
jgi:flavin reductase